MRRLVHHANILRDWSSILELEAAFEFLLECVALVVIVTYDVEVVDMKSDVDSRVVIARDVDAVIEVTSFETNVSEILVDGFVPLASSLLQSVKSALTSTPGGRARRKRGCSSQC